MLPSERLSVQRLHGILTFGFHKEVENAATDPVEKVSARLLQAMALGTGLWAHSAVAHDVDEEKLARKFVQAPPPAQVPKGPAVLLPRAAQQMQAALYLSNWEAQYDAWWQSIMSSDKVPYGEQLACLERVHQRCVWEQRRERGGCPCVKPHKHKSEACRKLSAEEPLRDLCHGLPGSGKSHLIMWL